ncbi:hypothetical protein [Desulfopila sp. IMCC35008]|uniref:hypothetical protein n=1 Tax=Desulfopila sp. IMCC35008 TaxID=2653858 RepID=UPI0013D3145B|nr:hypothetical protein [Desulfopila sp. IMCC35008]
MIITIDTTTRIDTDTDFGPAERHVLQKLFGWKSMVDSVAGFQEKTALALRDGWNNSGPVARSPKLDLVIRKLEEEVRSRLKT